MEDRLTAVPCTLCGKLVPLPDCTTNDLGEPVHEACLAERGDGFTRQLTAIKKYAAQNNIKIVRVFREEGVSGTTDWEDRPAFSEMMGVLLNNGVRTVLVERLDRVARDLMVQESVIADFQPRI